MSTRIDGPGPRITSPTTTDQPVGGASSTSSTSSTAPPNKTEDNSQSASRTTGALKQMGSEVKSQQAMTANLVKNGLNSQVGKTSDRTITFDKNAGYEKLAKIHVDRRVETQPPQTKMAKERIGNSKIENEYPMGTEPGKETVRTKFPNGVGLKTESSIEPKGEHILFSVSIEPPPGGKVTHPSDGVSVILDANGKEVGKLVSEFDIEGNMKATLNVHTKEGEYVQNSDGSIAFTPKVRAK